MKAALSHRPVPELAHHISDLVDHRYFYDKFDREHGAYMGHYTCGLSRDTVAKMLLASHVRFADHDFLLSLPDYINNPSVSGFMIEQAVLSSIALNGLDITPETNRPMEVNLFSGGFPDLYPETQNPVLHLPQVSNFAAIDGIIVRKESGSKGRGSGGKVRLLMFPLQITVTKKHSDSHEKFFKKWEDWIVGLNKFDVVPRFVWISENGGETKEHSESRKWPEHVEWNIPLSQVNELIGSFYKSVKQRSGDSGLDE
jgi:hypothetical protein